MIWLILTVILSACLFGYEEYQEWTMTIIGDIREHWASIPHRTSLIAIGYLFAKYGELVWIPLLLGIYWLFTDGVMNLLKRRNVFAVSKESGNPIEKWNLVKFGLIIGGIILIIV